MGRSFISLLISLICCWHLALMKALNKVTPGIDWVWNATASQQISTPICDHPHDMDKILHTRCLSDHACNISALSSQKWSCSKGNCKLVLDSSSLQWPAALTIQPSVSNTLSYVIFSPWSQNCYPWILHAPLIWKTVTTLSEPAGFTNYTCMLCHICCVAVCTACMIVWLLLLMVVTAPPIAHCWIH